MTYSNFQADLSVIKTCNLNCNVMLNCNSSLNCIYLHTHGFCLVRTKILTDHEQSKYALTNLILRSQRFGTIFFDTEFYLVTIKIRLNNTESSADSNHEP